MPIIVVSDSPRHQQRSEFLVPVFRMQYASLPTTFLSRKAGTMNLCRRWSLVAGASPSGDGG
jgi:hypothetical protein